MFYIQLVRHWLLYFKYSADHLTGSTDIRLAFLSHLSFRPPFRPVFPMAFGIPLAPYSPTNLWHSWGFFRRQYEFHAEWMRVITDCFTDWWLSRVEPTYPSEKWWSESQLGYFSIPNMMGKKTCSKPPSSLPFSETLYSPELFSTAVFVSPWSPGHWRTTEAVCAVTQFHWFSMTHLSGPGTSRHNMTCRSGLPVFLWKVQYGLWLMMG